jgi:hypothetical protein
MQDFPPAGAIENWSEWLKVDHTDEEKRLIRLHTSTGRAWCTPEMLVQLEAITGRDLKLRKAGRPRKDILDQTGQLPF